jgi:hypothetical protein
MLDSTSLLDSIEQIEVEAPLSSPDREARGAAAEIWMKDLERTLALK